MLVGMAAVDAEHVLKVASAENQDLVETFRADASHPTFGESDCDSDLGPVRAPSVARDLRN
jgi:hypothetical protein